MEKKELIEIICDALGITKPTKLILTQINKYVVELGLSYKEIGQALVYFMEVKDGDYKTEYGIGIVPHVIDEARIYFKRLKRQKDEQMESIKEAERQPDIILKPKTIRKRRRLETIEINDLDVD